jgi:phosphopantetheinyl transferase
LSFYYQARLQRRKVAVPPLPPPAGHQLDIWWSPRSRRRDILRHYLGDDQGVIFRDADGKPGLAGDDRLRFNLSHCAGVSVCAVGAGMEVGVDCEAIAQHGDLTDVVATTFCNNEQALLARAGAATFTPLFYALWTRKEAVVKAIGLGIALPLAEIDVSQAPFALASQVAVPSHGDCWVASLRAPPGLAAACSARRSFTVIDRTPKGLAEPVSALFI